MNALSEQGQLLEQARNKAVEIAQAYPAGTEFRLFTNDLEPKHQHNLNKEQFIQQVSQIQTSPAVTQFSTIHNRFSRQNNNPQSNISGILYYVSDFQRAVTDFENFSESEIFNYFLPLKPNQVNNLYIDSCWVEVPAHRLKEEENIFVRIKNNSDEDYQNLPIKLLLNDSLKSITNFSVDAQNEITASLKYTNASAGLQLGKIEITDYPFTNDNNWYISYFVEPKLKALAIFSNNKESMEGLKYLTALFENDNYIELDQMNIKSLQMNQLDDYNTIFLLNIENLSSGFLSELPGIIENGTSVAVFPSISNNRTANNVLLSNLSASQITGLDSTKQEISGIDFDNRFYADVFKKREKTPTSPKINGHLKFEEKSISSEVNLLWFQNGDKALSTLHYGESNVWIFSFPLDKQNESFARDILFVPTLYNIVLNSLPAQKISYTVGKDIFITIQEDINNIDMSSPLEIIDPITNEKFIPEKNITAQGIRIDLGGFIQKDGHFIIKSDDKTIAALAFNYDRRESDLRYISTDELEKIVENDIVKNAMIIKSTSTSFNEILDEIQSGKELWKWAILLALFFILAEVLISRFMK